MNLVVDTSLRLLLETTRMGRTSSADMAEADGQMLRSWTASAGTESQYRASLPSSLRRSCGSLGGRSELAQAVKGLPLELAAALLFNPEPLADFRVTLRAASTQAVATH
jgi:hypothetical protein